MSDAHLVKPDNDELRELIAIEGDEIVIRVSMDALVFATEHGPALEAWSDEHSRFRGVKVTDPRKWLVSVFRALRREAENGDTPVHLMLDAALRYAAEQGEEGIEIEDAP